MVFHICLASVVELSLVIFDLLEKYHYIGIKHLWRKHSILDQELLYEHFPKEILPYDYKTYAENPARFEMVTTNCITGRACYLEEKHDPLTYYCHS